METKERTLPENPDASHSNDDLPHAAWAHVAPSLSTGSASPIWDASGLRLLNYSASDAIFYQQDDAWVFQYEQAYAKLSAKRRKQGESQQGVFYTPPPVARYLTQQSLGLLLNNLQEKLEACKRSGNATQAAQVLAQTQAIRIIDPACGTGIFLMEALQLLTAFYEQAHTLFPDVTPSLPAHYTLTHQLYGIDIDALAVAIAEARLVQWASLREITNTAEHTQDSSALCHLRVGDTLSGSLFPADDFQGNTADGGAFERKAPTWDFVLGNPPYVSEVRKQAGRFRAHRQQNPYYHAKMDLCDAFLAWGIVHLKPGGQLAYILPEYWTQRASTHNIRRALWQQGTLRQVWIFPTTPLFKEAPGHHSALCIWEKNPLSSAKKPPGAPEDTLSRPVQFAVGKRVDDLATTPLQNAQAWIHPHSGKLLFGDTAEISLLERLAQCPPLFANTAIQQGLVMPQGRLREKDRRKLPEAIQSQLIDDTGIFILTEAEQRALHLNEAEQALLKPYFQPSDFQPFRGFAATTPEMSIIYMDAENCAKMRNNPNMYARIRAHLDQFSAINTSAFAPYGLHRARQGWRFEDTQKIMGLRQVEKPCFSVVKQPAYVNEAFYIMHPQRDTIYHNDPYCAVALLNSTLAWFWFYKQKRKGHRLQIDKDVLSVFPAPPGMTDSLQGAFSAQGQQLPQASSPLSASAQTEFYHALDTLVYQAYGLSHAEQAVIQSWQTRFS